MSERATMNMKPVFTVPTKTVINFKSHFDKKLLCDGLTFTAGSGCVYRCAFCYVESMQKKQEKWFKDKGVIYPPEGHLGVVIRTNDAVNILRAQLLSKPEEFRKRKLVIYSNPKVDVAGNMELVYETVEICKVILTVTNWHIRLLSKSNLLPKVAELLSNATIDIASTAAPTIVTRCHLGRNARERIIYGVSTGTLDDKLAAAFEEGTPKVSKRIESLHWLQDHGYRTFGMICPSLPQWDYAKFALDMANAIRLNQCESIWTEVINLRGDSFTRTKNCLFNAGFSEYAEKIVKVSSDKESWEEYARATFLAHANVYGGLKSPDGSPKLRHLQYVNKATSQWWEGQKENGAILL